MLAGCGHSLVKYIHWLSASRSPQALSRDLGAVGAGGGGGGGRGFGPRQPGRVGEGGPGGEGGEGGRGGEGLGGEEAVGDDLRGGSDGQILVEYWSNSARRRSATTCTRVAEGRPHGSGRTPVKDADAEVIANPRRLNTGGGVEAASFHQPQIRVDRARGGPLAATSGGGGGQAETGAQPSCPGKRLSCRGVNCEALHCEPVKRFTVNRGAKAGPESGMAWRRVQAPKRVNG
jgi:hypothetical protein